MYCPVVRRPTFLEGCFFPDQKVVLRPGSAVLGNGEVCDKTYRMKTGCWIRHQENI